MGGRLDHKTEFKTTAEVPKENNTYEEQSTSLSLNKKEKTWKLLNNSLDKDKKSGHAHIYWGTYKCKAQG